MHKISGLLFALSGFVILMGIITAEIFYPGYSTSQNYISTLGSSPPPEIIIKQPSASIFDGAMVLAGILVVASAITLHASRKDKLFVTAVVATGIGIIGVGIFPAYHGIYHDIVAVAAFASAGIASILSSRLTPSPFKYLSIFLGATSLTFLVIGVFFPHLLLSSFGKGGIERWIAYPEMIWLVVFGGYLMGGVKR